MYIMYYSRKWCPQLIKLLLSKKFISIIQTEFCNYGTFKRFMYYFRKIFG